MAMALPADRTNIGLILIKKDAPAENLRVPPFILQALLRSAGPVNVANVLTANNALIAYIGALAPAPAPAAASFQHILRAIKFANDEKIRFKVAKSTIFDPAVYYNNGEIIQIIYGVDGNPIVNAFFKIIQFTKTEIDVFLDIYHTLPEAGMVPAVDRENATGYFATRIKLVTTVFTKIYDKLKTNPADKKIVDDRAITAIHDAYANKGNTTNFIRFFKTIIIEGGLASTQSGLENPTELNKIDVTNTTEVELAMHYTGPTTEGSSTLFNKVVTIDADEKKLKLFFSDYLNATDDATKLVGGFRRRRNRKSSKKRSQKKSSKRKKSKRGRRSKRIRRSHRK
jgi:hypothetical protein